MFEHLRATFTLIFLNIKDSLITLLAILLFMAYFAYFAYLIFYTTFEGNVWAPTVGDSYFQFIVLLTTENYPYVFLNAFAFNWYSAFFFWGYLILAFFFL